MLCNRRFADTFRPKYHFRRAVQYRPLRGAHGRLFLQLTSAEDPRLPQLVGAHLLSTSPRRDHCRVFLWPGEEYGTRDSAALCDVGTSRPLHQSEDLSAGLALHHRADLRSSFLRSAVPTVARSTRCEVGCGTKQPE